jgi:hypothetical protein
MYSVETPRISTMRAGLFSKACRVASEFQRLLKILLGHPLVGKHGRKGLLGGRNQVLVLNILALHHFVQLLIELLQLCCLGHIVSFHEERRLDWIVVSVGEEVQAIVNECLIQEDTPFAQEVATVTDKLHASVWIIDFRSLHDFVVRQAVFLLDGIALRRPFLDDLVEVLVVVDGHGVVDIVADSFAALVAKLLLFCGFFLDSFLLLLEFDLLLQKFGGVLLVLDHVSDT